MDSKNISTELERVVRENISDVEMGVFQREMNRLQSIELEYVKLREDYKKQEEAYKVLISEYNESKAEIGSILEREITLSARENKMEEQSTQLHIDNKLIELRRENAEKRVEDHKEMVKLIFRGPVFQKSVIESGCHDQVTPTSINENGITGGVHRENGLNNNTTTEITEEQK